MSNESFLKYYQDELEFLVEGGKSLAKKHPSLSKTLDFSTFGSNDPDVQRLIESIAFLNAKLQKRLDDQAPELSNAIVNAIYPQFAAPIPSCMIVNFSLLAKAQEKKLIPRGTMLTSSKTYENQYYNFKTTMDVEITNYEIAELLFIKTASVKLPNSIYALCDNALYISFVPEVHKDGPCELVFHIHMIDSIAQNFYESLFSVYAGANTPIFEDGLQIGEIEPVGFAPEQALLSGNDIENSAYRILLEYNVFAKKFLFFKAKFNIAPKKEIVIPFNSKKEIFIKKGDLLLNCTPAINLFEKNSEPITVTQKQTNYTVHADSGVNKNTAIHSIVHISDTNVHANVKYSPYFGVQHVLDANSEYVFWLVKNTHSKQLDEAGDVVISFLDMNPKLEQKILYAKVLCYQTHAQNIEPEQLWNIVKTPGNLRCVNLDNPTSVIVPPMNSRAQWRLISHLAINYFGMESKNNQKALNYMKELLSIYNFQPSVSSAAAGAVHALNKLEYHTKMRSRNGAIIPVVEVELTVDESAEQVFLLGSILNKFFADTLNFNTKMNFTLCKNNRAPWKQWIGQ